MPCLSSHHKLRGERAESRFLLQAVQHGLIVSKPWGDSAPYDFIVDSGSRLHRVQVRSASRLDGRAYRISTGRGSRFKRPYTAQEIDTLAAYIEPEDTWYIVPVGAFSPRKNIALAPHLPGSRRQFEPWRAAWWVLGA